MGKGIEGFDQLMKKYRALAEVVSYESMEAAMKPSIKMVQAEAKLLCTVDSGELRGSIKTSVESSENRTVGTVYTNKKTAHFVENGTGPKGQADHTGISPEIIPAYSQSPWWIHESQVDAETAEKYHWFYIDTEDGRFYQCSGQAAQPFMYPALKNNEDRATKDIANFISREIRKATK